MSQLDASVRFDSERVRCRAVHQELDQEGDMMVTLTLHVQDIVLVFAAALAVGFLAVPAFALRIGRA